MKEINENNKLKKKLNLLQTSLKNIHDKNKNLEIEYNHVEEGNKVLKQSNNSYLIDIANKNKSFESLAEKFNVNEQFIYSIKTYLSVNIVPFVKEKVIFCFPNEPEIVGQFDIIYNNLEKEFYFIFDIFKQVVEECEKRIKNYDEFFKNFVGCFSKYFPIIDEFQVNTNNKNYNISTQLCNRIELEIQKNTGTQQISKENLKTIFKSHFVEIFEIFNNQFDVFLETNFAIISKNEETKKKISLAISILLDIIIKHAYKISKIDDNILKNLKDISSDLHCLKRKIKI